MALKRLGLPGKGAGTTQCRCGEPDCMAAGEHGERCRSVAKAPPLPGVQLLSSSKHQTVDNPITTSGGSSSREQ